MERTLARHLPEHGGFFVEAGANDGYTQSNTYWLERFCGWEGILIEPIPALAKHARGCDAAHGWFMPLWSSPTMTAAW